LRAICPLDDSGPSAAGVQGISDWASLIFRNSPHPVPAARGSFVQWSLLPASPASSSPARIAAPPIAHRYLARGFHLSLVRQAATFQGSFPQPFARPSLPCLSSRLGFGPSALSAASHPYSGCSQTPCVASHVAPLLHRLLLSRALRSVHYSKLKLNVLVVSIDQPARSVTTASRLPVPDPPPVTVRPVLVLAPRTWRQ
jgi:hypothetical protein